MQKLISLITNKKFVIPGLVVVLFVVWLILTQRDILPIFTQMETETASTTDTILAPEPPFVLPPGAVAIDDYAYTQDGSVYFRSLTGNQPLHIQDADPNTFKRLSEFMSYHQQDTALAACGADPDYAYYGDKKRLYFYQIWRAPKFRVSRVEVIVGATRDEFEIAESGTATDGTYRFEIGHSIATSTCALTLSRSDL